MEFYYIGLYILLLVVVIVQFLIIYNFIKSSTSRFKDELIHLLSKKSEETVSNNATEAEYIIVINNASKDTKQRVIESCFKRLPCSYELLNNLWVNLKKELENTSDLIHKRSLITKMDNYLKIYNDNASMSDIFKADWISMEIDNLSLGLIQEMKESERNFLVNIITMMEKNIELLEHDIEDESVILTLEELDGTVDRNRIKQHNDLLNRYKQVSNKLSELFASNVKVDDASQKQKVYNTEAMEAFRKALDTFNESKGILQDKENRVKQIVDLIGKWDNKYFYQPVQTYTSSVYMSIFSKLKNNEQFNISKLMIEISKKEL